MSRRLIVTADDFGLSSGVNAAVKLAAASGILTSASLMVSAPAAADAVVCAKAMPTLAVGLHLVVIDGVPTLPAAAIPDLVDGTGRFPADQLRLGIDYFFRPLVRRQLAAEIRAQFEAFRATGLKLDHANAHKHMHLHPTVGRLMIDIGRDYGLAAIRVPAEPKLPNGRHQSVSDAALRRWCTVLRRQARAAGMFVNDHLLGLGWTGDMTRARTQILLNALPPGLTEMYFHPATERNATLQAAMPSYQHEAELDALINTIVPDDVALTTYGREVAQHVLDTSSLPAFD